MITELEAEEYLNPAALGAGAGALQQPNMQARNVVRAGIVAHGIMLGVLLLMLGLIHVAPLGGDAGDVARHARRSAAASCASTRIRGRRCPSTASSSARRRSSEPLELPEGAHVDPLRARLVSRRSSARSTSTPTDEDQLVRVDFAPSKCR